MPLFESSLAFASNMIGGRPCATCKSPMIVVQTKPAGLGSDLRTFECVTCGTLEKVSVPTKSSKWRGSHLHRPK